jgi:hypothetical protein
MNDKELIKMLEEECAALRQQLKDCNLYMTDDQKWKMARDRAAIEYDLRVERCD